VEKVATWLGTNLPPAIDKAAKFFDENLKPPLTDIGVFLRDTLVPKLKELWSWVEEKLLPALRDAVERAMPTRVNLLGYLPPERIREILVRSGLLVAPSIWQEPLGLVVLEAMACGVPVVASSVGGIPEIVQHNANGLLVEPGDPDALARAMNLVLGDPSLRGRLREHCLTRTTISSYRDLAPKAVT